MQTLELEPLKQQIAELQEKQKQAEILLSASKDVDESNRVDIRNLQNALDSSKTELTAYRTELNDAKTKMLDYEKEVADFKLKEQDLAKQIEEQKAKNNVS
jgi:predicted  nucleic acid-binding Zn-ribbon protein